MKLIFQCLSNEPAENYDRPGGKFRTVSGIRHDAGKFALQTNSDRAHFAGFGENVCLRRGTCRNKKKMNGKRKPIAVNK